jgi:hypothetical protein
MVSLDEAREMLDSLVAELPEEIFARLNGGVLLMPEVKLSAEAIAGDLYTLGEYENSYHMGRTVRIYYGSILRAHGAMPPERFRETLREVLHHELTHHLESMAGEHGLEDDDALHLAWYKLRH